MLSVKKLIFILLCPLLLLAAYIAYLLLTTTFNPNYIEFGPYIVLYKNEDCARPTEDTWEARCAMGGRSDSMYKNKNKSLAESLKYVIYAEKKNNRANNTSSDPNDWSCAVVGRRIDNIYSEIVTQDTRYKCWPKD